MEGSNRARQWYGYTVCLIALVIGILCFAGLLDNAFDLSHPLGADSSFEPSLTSFDAYQATRGARFGPMDQRTAPDTASEATLRARYEALRADRIVERTFQARKGIVKDVLLLVLALALFRWHWRWLRRGPDSESPLRAA